MRCVKAAPPAGRAESGLHGWVWVVRGGNAGGWLLLLWRSVNTTRLAHRVRIEGFASDRRL